MLEKKSDKKIGKYLKENTKEDINMQEIEFSEIMDNIPFGIMLLNHKNEIRYINKKFIEMFGYNIDEIPNGKTWLRKAYPDPIYRHEIIDKWLKEIKTDYEEKNNAWILSVTCKDNTVKTVNFIPVRLVNGDYIITCEDINEVYGQANRLFYILNIDPLTGLPNRQSLESQLRLLIEKAKQGKQRGSRSALIFADIDDFEEINHNFGYNTGDEVLIRLAKILRNSLRAGDRAFRFEGDEFAIILKSISMAEAKLAAERIQKTINQSVLVLDYTKHNFNVSMGIIQIDGTMDVITLISNASQTVQRSKKLGKNIISLF